LTTDVAGREAPNGESTWGLGVRQETESTQLGCISSPSSPVFREITHKGVRVMTEPTKPSDPLVWVKDKEGNEFICAMSQLKDPKKASKEELAKCVDSGSAAYDPGN